MSDEFAPTPFSPDPVDPPPELADDAEATPEAPANAEPAAGAHDSNTADDLS